MFVLQLVYYLGREGSKDALDEMSYQTYECKAVILYAELYHIISPYCVFLFHLKLSKWLLAPRWVNQKCKDDLSATADGIIEADPYICKVDIRMDWEIFCCVL